MMKESEVLAQLSPQIKIWLELDGDRVLGKGGALLLRAIEEKGSISQAVQSLPIDALSEKRPPSYRFAWDYLRQVEERLGAAIVEKTRGSRAGTGGTQLTKLGQRLLNLYEIFENVIDKAISKAKSKKILDKLPDQ